jgi:oxygen-dependent protoporphyrinogen oxidase
VRRIAVIGAGLAGLVVAFRRMAEGDQVLVLEASPRPGGQIHSVREAGFVIEHGAEGFVAGSEAVRELACDLGIEGNLVGQLVTRSFGFDGERLAELKPGEAGELLGFQVPRREFGKGIGSFRTGMGALTGPLYGALAGNVDVRLGAGVGRVGISGKSIRLELEAGGSEEADALVVATSARSASALLAPDFGAVASELSRAETVSSVTVSLAYAREDVVHPLDGTGFVVAEAAQDDGFRAATFVSSKLEGRAPASHALLRAFFRPTPADLTLSDDAWAARADRALRRALELRGIFERAWVSRWPDALPVFDDAHRERVKNLEAALAERNAFLTGSAFHGSGIDAAIRSAEATARALG